MNRKRVSIRFNLDCEDDRKAWEYLHRNSDLSISREIISITNKYLELSKLENLLRNTIAEELAKRQPSRETAHEENDNNTEDIIMEFLDSF